MTPSSPRPAAGHALADPVRKILTLEGFAATETQGGLSIAAAAGRVHDEKLRKQLECHAADELRHGELFRQRAAALRAESGVPKDREAMAMPVKLLDEPNGNGAGSKHALNEHGFFEATALDDVGDVAYVAMLHVAEQKAAAFFKKLRKNLRDDEATAAIIDEVLKDELFHISYTGACLKQRSQEGRKAEVREALRLTRGKRTFDAWRRFGARAASRACRAFTFLLYYTVAAPFGLLARLQRERAGWQPARRCRGPDDLRSQF